jgi:hypothetical protein
VTFVTSKPETRAPKAPKENFVSRSPKLEIATFVSRSARRRRERKIVSRSLEIRAPKA